MGFSGPVPIRLPDAGGSPAIFPRGAILQKDARCFFAIFLGPISCGCGSRLFCGGPYNGPFWAADFICDAGGFSVIFPGPAIPGVKVTSPLPDASAWW